MEIRAYDESYVQSAQNVLGHAVDFAVMTLEISPEVFGNAFCVSNASKQFAIGNPRYVAGMNGCELARLVLEEAKVPYVPADGVILPEITVEFTPGENVFDVLQRVCEAADIPLEYIWTPLYDSYYLEGICHLYEFDCGPESGWMYQVSGKFPNYGCSSYEVQPGDRIEWLYSCIGLGADLGADVMEG